MEADNEPKAKGAGSWTLTPRSFLTLEELKALRDTALSRARARRWRKRSKVLEWIVLEIALETGLRVFEIAALACGDIESTDAGGVLLVRKGKGAKSRIVWFSKGLERKVRFFLRWKVRRGEPVTSEAPLLLSKATGQSMTSRALQKMFTRLKLAAGICGHSFHHLRHTHASYLLKSSGNNLPMVMRQLGHSSIKTTQTYLHALDEETSKAVNQLYAIRRGKAKS